MTKTVLVTGAYGFIFSNFVNLLNKSHPDWKIVIIDKKTYAADPSNIVNPQEDVFVYDVNDSRIFNVLSVYRPDIIVHAAASSHVDNSIKSDRKFWESNVLGTQNLLLAYKSICPGSLFININTDEVYGSYDWKKDINPEKVGYGEGQPYAPTSPYAASKACQQFVTDSYHITYGLDNIISVFCTNNYGPRQHKEKFIPTCIMSALQDKPIPLYGEGNQVRDWMYVEDCCQAILKLCEFEGKFASNAKFNISAMDQPVENKELAEMILTELKKPVSLINYIDDPRGKAHDYKYKIDSWLFRSDFGWEPKTDLTAGLKKTIEWYKEKLK